MKPLHVFGQLHTAQQSALLMLAATGASLLIANVFPHLQLSRHLHDLGITGIIEDGLMPLFFLLMGLEIREELTHGSLSTRKKALLPVIAAIGGMVVPGCWFLVFNFGKLTWSGWGIPMATDIAFALAIVALLGHRAPRELRIFLTTLAVVDDLGAILLIATFYSEHLHVEYLSGAAVMVLVLTGLRHKKIDHLVIYALGGVLLWLCILKSGIHATIAGVIVAFLLPGNQQSWDQVKQWLHLPVNYIILPLFAFIATAINVNIQMMDGENLPIIFGVAGGLLIGKPLGIFGFTEVARRIGAGEISSNLNRATLFGIGLTGGIGFTMSVFIADRAYQDALMNGTAKLAILLASLLASFAGLLYFRRLYR
ncbi:MAG: Na+/H+ antiporter NhaA [Chitinophagales bacterium]